MHPLTISGVEPATHDFFLIGKLIVADLVGMRGEGDKEKIFSVLCVLLAICTYWGSSRSKSNRTCVLVRY